MSENKNYDENTQFDELNIKFHLNDSLDLSGISVSEDLINRTLLAIKKQSELQSVVAEGNESQKDNNAANQISGIDLSQTDEIKNQKATNKKVIQWNRYFRAFAGVAAAMVVVAVGYGLASNGAFSGYKTSSSKDQAYDTTATKEAADKSTETEVSDNLSTSQSEESSSNVLAPNENTFEGDYSVNSALEDSKVGVTQGTEESANAGIMGGGTDDSSGTYAGIESPQYSIVAEVPAADSKADSGALGSSAAGSSGTTGSSENQNSDLQSTEPSMKKSQITHEIVRSFKDIFLADPTKASSLTITDELNDVSVVLTKKEDIQSFYTMMEQYQFTNGDQANDTSNYVIEIATPAPSMTRYIMYIGDSIVVDYADDVTSSHNVYATSTLTELSTAIQEFCQKYRK